MNGRRNIFTLSRTHLPPHTEWYNTIRDAILTCAQKRSYMQVSLIYRITEPKTKKDARNGIPCIYFPAVNLSSFTECSCESLMGLLQLRYEHDSSTIRLRFDYNTLQHATRFFVRSYTRSYTRISGKRVLHVDWQLNAHSFYCILI